jgi:hypothetical protein
MVVNLDFTESCEVEMRGVFGEAIAMVKRIDSIVGNVMTASSRSLLQYKRSSSRASVSWESQR